MNTTADAPATEAIPRSRRRRPRIRRAVVGALVVVALLLAVAAVAQRVAEQRDERAFPSAQLVDVDGRRLHLEVSGASRPGLPTVLLDAGSASTQAQWGWVQQALSGRTRVVSFDRPGVGRSDPADGVPDVRRYAADLREALGRVGVGGPYVLVGHSMGALTTRAFAALFPDEVAGVVLVDPRIGRLQDDWPEVGPLPASTPPELQLAPVAAAIGLLRLVDPLGDHVDQLPPAAAGRARAALASVGHWAGVFPDAQLGESAAALLHDRGGAPREVPLTILSATEPDASIGGPADRARFTALHERAARELSARGEHVLVTGADHVDVVTDQRHAQVVARAVDDVLDGLPTGAAP